MPAGKGILPPLNPSRSMHPNPNFRASVNCKGGKDGASCNSLVLKAIGAARKALEQMAGPSFSMQAYQKLSPQEQIFVTVNLERVARGLPAAVALTKSLNKIAQAGAKGDEDPPLTELTSPLPGGGRLWGADANWIGGWDNALGSDYAWMYNDGAGGSNPNCTRTDIEGCWIDRDNILGTLNTKALCGGQNELVMGAGHVTTGDKYGDSETELLVGVCGATPTDVVLTWAKAKTLLHYKG
jgi:hypothetical protein